MPVGAFKFTQFAATGSALHSYTQSWVDRVITAGGTVSSARQTVVNTFVIGLITDGLLDGTTIANSIIKYFLLLASDGFAGCNVPLIDAASAGNASLNNFVSGDYSSAGLTGNSSSKSVLTNFYPDPSLSSDNGALLGIYTSAGAITAAFFSYGCTSGYRLLCYGTSTYVGGQAFTSGASEPFNGSISYAHGLNFINKLGASARLVQDSTLLASVNTATGLRPAANIAFFSVYNGTIFTDFMPFTHRMCFVGDGLTITQEGTFNSRCQTLASSL